LNRYIPDLTPWKALQMSKLQGTKCLESATPKDPSRRVRCAPEEARRTFRREIPVGLAAPDHTVPYGTVLSRNAFPGTSCLATISLALRDKSHSPLEGPRLKL